MPSIFFYPSSLTLTEIGRVVTRFGGPRKLHPAEPDPFNVIEFADENGGTATHAFAVKYDSGMDAIEVTDATLAFRVTSMRAPISKFAVTALEGGAKLALNPPKPARLSSVVLKCPNPPVLALGSDKQLVVRPMDSGAPAPPLFAFPPITLGSNMYSSVTRALDVVPLADGSGYTVTFANPLLGTAWLFQIVKRGDPMALQPDPHALTFGTVTIDAAPTDLVVTLKTATGDVPVWNHPGPLYPDNGLQTIGFAPIARKQLGDQLGAATGPALPLTLAFTSASAGKLELLPAQSALSTVYVAKPLQTDPTTLPLSGSWVPLQLSAPALSPATVRGVMRVKPRGQEVNAMTPVADADFGSAGAIVDTARWIAVSSHVAPRAGSPEASTLALTGVRLPLASERDSEIVVEIHADVAGLPGPVAGAPVVAQLAAKTSATTTFALKSAVTVVTGGAPLWVLARCTKGAVRWHAARPQPANGGEVRASDDGGKTWRKLDPDGVGGAVVPFAQLLQAAPPTDPPPAVRVRVRVSNGTPALAAPLAAGAAGTIQFPSTVLAALAAAQPAPAAKGKATTTIELASDAVVDVTFSGLAFVYAP